MENLPIWAQILVIALPSIGAARLLELLITRRFATKDGKQQTTQQNEAHALAADTQFRADLMNRIKNLEEEQKKLNSDFNEQGIENASLKIENKHLVAQNTRQEAELDKLRIKDQEQQRQIVELEKRLDVLRSELSFVTTQCNNLQFQLNQLQKTRDVEIEKEILRRIGRSRNRKLQIVIVEDDQATVDLFKQLLKRSDVDHFVFADGKDAMDWLRSNECSVAVIDLALAGNIDGLSLVERIRGHERRNKLIPSRIVLYTGYEITETIRADADNFNVEAVLTKTIHTPQNVVDLVLGDEVESK